MGRPSTSGGGTKRAPPTGGARREAGLRGTRGGAGVAEGTSEGGGVKAYSTGYLVFVGLAGNLYIFFPFWLLRKIC